VASWIGPEWKFDAPGRLMWLPLRPSPTAVPDGYRLRTWSHGGLTRALVTTQAGAFAARAQTGRPPGSAAAVVYQVETAPAHRRRGLGALVMHTLQNAALEAGAERAVLGATVEGRALYTALGLADGRTADRTPPPR
jgi:GNAT superfamily N-acetyltransferase